VISNSLTYIYTDTKGCVDSVSKNISVEICGGTNDIESSYSIEVYPNPNSGKFTIELICEYEESFVVKVTNMLGQEVLIERLECSTSQIKKQFHLLTYPTGIHNIRIMTERGAINKQVIFE